jgi:hypothetical protein
MKHHIDFKILKNANDNTSILYYENVDIDGFHGRQPFYDLIINTGRKNVYNRAHEWCCGHGAIGFKILEEQLCNHLVLTDKYEPATTGCKFTVAANDLLDKVTVYTVDNLGYLPTSEKWDLFIANPPWRPTEEAWFSHLGPFRRKDVIRKMYDINWETHDMLWNNIGNYITDDADIYLWEHSAYSNQDTWKHKIDKAGLKIYAVYPSFISTNYANGQTYVMHLVKNTGIK